MLDISDGMKTPASQDKRVWWWLPCDNELPAPCFPTVSALAMLAPPKIILWHVCQIISCTSSDMPKAFQCPSTKGPDPYPDPLDMAWSDPAHLSGHIWFKSWSYSLSSSSWHFSSGFLHLLFTLPGFDPTFQNGQCPHYSIVQLEVTPLLSPFLRSSVNLAPFKPPLH